MAVLHFSCEKQGDANTASPTSGGAGGSLARFAIAGNYLYTVDYNTLHVYDISDPVHPAKKSDSYVGFQIETIFPYKDKLFIGGSVGMYVYSLGDPANPKKEGQITHFLSCDPVVSNDSVSYVTLRSFGTTCNNSNRNVLNVYTIKNLYNPGLVKTIDLKSPYGLGLKQKGLYVCEGTNGMTVFQLNDPFNPVRIKEFKDEIYYDVIPYGDVLIAYVEKGICFFDISNPLEPILLSKLKG
jgi:hypothetical protein